MINIITSNTICNHEYNIISYNYWSFLTASTQHLGTHKTLENSIAIANEHSKLSGRAAF